MPRPSTVLHTTAMGCVARWIRAKTVTQEQRGDAERRELFVGLWPAQLGLLGDAAERGEQRRRRPR
jgi:hypothetical protein